jgi:5-formyltetrahydrofolate cyclo-ligase
MHDKRHLRSAIAARRAARDPVEIAAAGLAIGRSAPAVLGDAKLIAAYIGVGVEPPTDALIDAFVVNGGRVLLPIVNGDELLWGDYSGPTALVPSPLGLLEPTGTRLGPETIGDCDLVVVPALAVDRRGRRLGRGGGFYDRALRMAAKARIVAVVYDDEVVDEVPVEPHDVSVDAAVTPSGLLTF